LGCRDLDTVELGAVAATELREDGHASRARNGNVLALGKLDEKTLANWYARADIYCLPATYEPFGLSALEAALSGCALVLGDIPSLREVWADAAVYVHPNDTDALRAQLVALIASPLHRLRLATRATSRAILYSPQRMAEEYLHAYQQLLRRQRAIEAETRIADAFVTVNTANPG
jgi:glycosyltransferase involved in cell wall biosynthesis